MVMLPWPFGEAVTHVGLLLLHLCSVSVDLSDLYTDRVLQNQLPCLLPFNINPIYFDFSVYVL